MSTHVASTTARRNFIGMNPSLRWSRERIIALGTDVRIKLLRPGGEPSTMTAPPQNWVLHGLVDLDANRLLFPRARVRDHHDAQRVLRRRSFSGGLAGRLPRRRAAVGAAS